MDGHHVWRIGSSFLWWGFKSETRTRHTNQDLWLDLDLLSMKKSEHQISCINIWSRKMEKKCLADVTYFCKKTDQAQFGSVSFIWLREARQSSVPREKKTLISKERFEGNFKQGWPLHGVIMQSAVMCLKCVIKPGMTCCPQPDSLVSRTVHQQIYKDRSYNL